MTAARAARPAPTTIADVTWRRLAGDRPAVILIVTTARGAIGVGEAAPLPGRSTDDTDGAVAAFAALAARLPIVIDASLAGAAELAAAASGSAASVHPSLGSAARSVHPSLGSAARFVHPSLGSAARFAIETAALDAIARERGVAVAELLAPGPAAAVPINALVDDPGAATRAVARGIRTLKVKLRAGDDAHARLAAIRAAVGPAIAIRADANRGWPTATALARLRALVDLDLEYVEEPCPDTASIAAAAPVPVALDETVAEHGDTALVQLLGRDGLAALVLKPTLIGGLARATALAARAARCGVAAVVTHALEGPIGTAACAELARALAGRRAVGLDVHPGLARWPRTTVPQLAAATVRAAGRPGLGLDHAAVLADLAELAP